jgi:hypothetical protein
LGVKKEVLMNAEKVSGYSTSGLLMMHQGIRHALETDDNLPQGQAKPYGVREYQDWKSWSDLIESELDHRKVTYQKVPW